MGVEVPTPLGAFAVTAGVVFVVVEVVSTDRTGGGFKALAAGAAAALREVGR